MKKTPTILILGIHGMLGHTLFQYFLNLYPKTTWGTTRKTFSVATYEKDFKKIAKKISKIDFVINAIAITQKDEDIEDIIQINSLFPHQLEALSTKYGFKLIHVSTDAVFSKDCGRVHETSTVSPTTLYGASKLLGETNSKNAITIRTSLLGLSPYKKEGLLERVKKQKAVKASIHQRWSGCTTLQMAKLCEYLCHPKVFNIIRKTSPLFHFAPLDPTNRYRLLKTYLSLISSKVKLTKSQDVKCNRSLKTNYSQLLRMETYTSNLKTALQDLLKFEKEDLNSNSL